MDLFQKILECSDEETPVDYTRRYGRRVMFY